MTIGSRDVDWAKCSCGGIVEEIDPTPEEDQDNCPRGCCLKVYSCNTCRTRFRFKLEAPEME